MVEIASPVSSDAVHAIDLLLAANKDARWLLTEDEEIVQAACGDPDIARHFRRTGELLILALQARLAERPLFDNVPRLLEYLQLAIGGLREERLVVMYFDAKLCLVDTLTVQGTADSVTINPRAVVLRALVTGATSIVLAHNHPSGDPTASKADIAVTRTLAHALKPIDVRLHDHIIIGSRDEHTSMRAMGLL